MTGSLRTTRGRWRRAALLPALAVAVMAPLLAGPRPGRPADTKPAKASAAKAKPAKAKPVTTSYENPLAPVIPGAGRWTAAPTR
jgi:hypothetical protein